MKPGPQAAARDPVLPKASGGPAAPLSFMQRLLRLRHRWLPWLRRQVLARRGALQTPFQPRLFGRPLTRTEIGIAGETLAARWLRKQGRKVLQRNHGSLFGGELDIVARHGEVLTFVEVKTRTQTAHGRPADAVNEEKRRLIRNGAQSWLKMLGQPKITYRFDVVEVLLIPGERPRIHVIENAFGMPASSLSGR